MFRDPEGESLSLRVETAGALSGEETGMTLGEVLFLRRKRFRVALPPQRPKERTIQPTYCTKKHAGSVNAQGEVLLN